VEQIKTIRSTSDQDYGLYWNISRCKQDVRWSFSLSW